ncbi:hypothetical protein [Peptostreptococcus faecalis]|uniref:hypothetical protein n=1 Tax=Peptostreptococcus faecalis TaxID=2045015 RepID=UPI000C7B0840|nr:hypothetical protein [Peptostreptococcus faecalis]
MTKTEDIYEIFLSQIDDELFAMLSPNTMRKQLHNYLVGATAKFKKCKKDLTILDYKNKKITIDTDFLDFDKDEVKESFINVFGEETGIEYKKGIDWVMEGENRIIFEIPPQEPVSVVFYNDGYFEDTLSNEEVFILVKGMIIYWLQPKVNREENLKNMVTDGDYKKLSGANMLDKMIKLYKTTLREFELAVINYTYNDFKGFN